MSYKDATAFAASLAATLMVLIVVFQAADGTCTRRSRGGVLCKPEHNRYGRLVAEKITLR